MKQTRVVLLLGLLPALASLLGCSSTSTELPGLRITATPAAMSALVGQECVFLVQIAHQDNAGAVTITAVAPGSTVAIQPAAITAGQVAEVTITPGVSTLGTAVAVSIRADQDDKHDSETPTINVIPGADTREAKATGLRDTFVAWLQANRPDFNITDATTWEGTITQPDVLTPAHYLFFSSDWEMGLAWSTSSPPSDWALMYLRRRTQERKPTYGLQIASLSAGDTPSPIGPPLFPYR